jgi:HAD superfamily hydrolase (TIGR01509 family)
MVLRALIFDVDGTLAETEEAHRDAFNRTFAEFGLPWSWDQALYRELLRVSGGKERIRAFVARHDPARDDAGLGDLIAALHRRKTELYTAAVAAGGVPLRPGVERLIGEARDTGLTLAVATTTTRANVLALMDGATGGAGHGWFTTLVCAEDAPVKKPDPQAYTLALDRVGLPASACMALEDSVNGVRAARAAGIPVVVSESVYTAGDDFTGACAVFPDFGSVTLADLRRLHGERRA